MKKIEKLIYSVKFLPQVLYFGSSALILLILIFDIEAVPIIPVFIIFLYMTYLVSKNYKSGGIDPIEKLIYSKKYLLPLLYFGSLAWLIYTFYYEFYLGKEIEIFTSSSANYILSDLFIFWFLYITYLAIKNYKLKNKYGGKK